jgi:hypothetical protein
MNEALDALLRHPGIWRGGQLARLGAEGIPTGFPDLDAELPGGGWPTGAVTEIFAEGEGIGELRLAMPALARLTREGRRLAWIAPPHIPYAPALAAAGIRLSRMIVVRAETSRDALWAAEQALRSGSCGAVLAWPAAEDGRALRRLQLAAEAGGAWGLFYRPGGAAASPSPAALRLRVEAAEGKLVVRILKRRGGGAAAPLFLDVNHAVVEPVFPPSAPGNISAGRRRA